MNIFLLALVSISVSVLAQFSFREGMTLVAATRPIQINFGSELLGILQNRYILIGFGLYGAGAILWLRVLSAWEVSKAYPLVGLGFAASVLIGFLLGEAVSVTRVVGVSLICLGVAVVSRS